MRLTRTLRTLARDTRGNTLAIVAAALVPLTAMIGSGVDMSRAYMAKSRLQNACDAAALAGRRVMMADQMSDDVRAEATRFFNFNFPQNLYQTAAFEPQVSRSGVGTVRVAAATTIPTSIMFMFGYDKLALNVECDASLNYVNTDVMLVLDTTGSMAQDINGNSTSNVADQKITALRDAVLALYDALAPTQTQLEAAGMRLRYGMVPYSSTVNVGDLIRAANPAYLVDTMTVQSRVATYDVSQKKGGFTSRNWIQQPVSYDVSRYKLGQPITIATDRNGTATVSGAYSPQRIPTAVSGASTTSVTWNGCIEERDTVNTITTNSGLTAPSGAYDLDINLVPDRDQTRWRPMLQDVVRYRPNGTASSDQDWGAGSSACPYGARRLTSWTRTALQTYVNALRAQGSTYHDIGMIWGSRLLSSAGIFADSPDTFNNMPVSRHVIFMTDGQLAPSSGTYSGYGVEYLDQRVTGSSTAADQYNRHLQRFRIACNQARSQNQSIWVIAFGTALTQDMIDCASNPNQASTAGNRQALIDRFTEIGQNIGALRLVQ